MEKISLNTTRSLIPPVYYDLSRVGENELAYRHYNVRHPCAIFSIHFSDVIKAFNDLSLLINNLQLSQQILTEEQMEQLQSSTITFLLRLTNYFDCGYEIFLCFCNKHDQPSQKEYLHTWFEKNKYTEVKEYFKNIKELNIYRNFFNELKHSSHRLAIFQVLSPDSTKILGWYLEGVNDAGAIGPVQDFHPQFDGMYTVWSYDFHLRIFYYLIYKIAIEIDEVVHKLCQKNSINLPIGNIPLNPVHIEELCSKAFSGFGRRFNDRGIFYSQEVGQKTKKVVLDVDHGTLSFEDFYPQKTLDPKSKKVFHTRGDGFSRSFNMIFTKGDEK